MKQRLNHETKPEAEMKPGQLRQESTGENLEFKSLEEAIRFDAARTEVPADLRERVLREVAGERAQWPWWKRWFL